MKLLITLLFSIGVASTSESDIALANYNADTSVYICVSETAKKYHYDKNCRGLNKCSHEIKKVTLSDAKGKYTRTLCGWED